MRTKNLNKSKLNYFKNILDCVESQSTCSRVKVGALAVFDGRVILTGWNGVAKGDTHCCDHFTEDEKNQSDFRDKHSLFSKFEIHAEANLIAMASRIGIKLENTILFVSITPCLDCAKMIVQSGFKKVYFKGFYDRSREGYDYLVNHSIEMIKLEE